MTTTRPTSTRRPFPEEYVERVATSMLPGVDNLSPKLTRRVKVGGRPDHPDRHPAGQRAGLEADLAERRARRRGACRRLRHESGSEQGAVLRRSEAPAQGDRLPRADRSARRQRRGPAPEPDGGRQGHDRGAGVHGRPRAAGDRHDRRRSRLRPPPRGAGSSSGPGRRSAPSRSWAAAPRSRTAFWGSCGTSCRTPGSQRSGRS